MKYLYALLLIPFMISCNSGNRDQGKKAQQDTVIIPAKPSKFPPREDCYKDRQTVKVVSNRSAKVLKAGKLGILDCYELGERYQPCMLPDWAVKGTEVKISGVVKEVQENERLAGTPFFISEITKPESE